MSLITLALNQTYPQPIVEGIRLELFRGGHNDLIIAMPNIDKEEIADFRRGKIRVGVHGGEHLVLVFFKFGSQPWMDAPFNACLIPEFEYQKNTFLDPRNDQQRFSINLTLIDSASGLVKALRSFTLAPATSRKLQALAEKQRSKGFSPYEADQELARLLSKTTKQLVRNIETTLAGTP